MRRVVDDDGTGVLGIDRDHPLVEPTVAPARKAHAAVRVGDLDRFAAKLAGDRRVADDPFEKPGRSPAADAVEGDMSPRPSAHERANTWTFR